MIIWLHKPDAGNSLFCNINVFFLRSKLLEKKRSFFSSNSTQILYAGRGMLLKIWWNKYPPACLASYLKDLLPLHMSPQMGLHLFSLYEEGRGKNVSPLWLRQHSKQNLPWWMLPIPARIQTGTACPGWAGTQSRPKRKWLRPASGCGGFSLVVMPSSLWPHWHHKPRKC